MESMKVNSWESLASGQPRRSGQRWRISRRNAKGGRSPLRRGVGGKSVTFALCRSHSPGVSGALGPGRPLEPALFAGVALPSSTPG